LLWVGASIPIEPEMYSGSPWNFEKFQFCSYLISIMLFELLKARNTVALLDTQQFQPSAQFHSAQQVF
jgi:hypothetical protein